MVPARSVALVLLAVLGGALLYAALRFGGAVAGALAGVALVLAAVVALRATRPDDALERERLGRLGSEALCLLPGLLALYLGFTAGGFFPDSWGYVTVALAAALVLRVVFARRPFEGFGWPVATAAGALALFTAWTYASGSWSNAPARALIEADRALMYLFALVLFGSLGRTPERLRIMVRGLAAAFFVLALTGLLSRTLPELVPSAQTLAPDRLSYPVTYWNALGLVAALGAVLSLHLTSDEKEPGWVRVLGAAALPALLTCLYFTLSRGAIGAGVGGVALYLLLGRPRGLVSGLLAVGPSGAYALASAYGADQLALGIPTSPVAAAQGEDVARVVALSSVAAAGLRLALLLLDAQLSRIHLGSGARRPAGAVAVLALVAVAASATIALDLPQRIDAQYERFRAGDSLPETTDPRQRLTQVGNNGRFAHWRVAARMYEAEPTRGHGAGTFEVVWARERPTDFHVLDAHSLYLEVLSELGVVGLVLLGVSVAPILAAFALRAHGRNRALHAALLAAALTWAVRAGIDWDWEMPVLTLWLFAVGGLALARRPRGGAATDRSSLLPRVVAAACCVVLVVPSVVVTVSEQRLTTSLDAFRRGDCGGAVSSAEGSLAALERRAEPHEVIGYCLASEGRYRPAVASFERAVLRDPENWEAHFGLALARGAAGLDPRQAAARAARLNPREEDNADAVRRLARAAEPKEWEELATGTALPDRFRAEQRPD